MDGTAFRKGTADTLLRRIAPSLGPVAAVLLAVSAAFFCYAMPARIAAPLIEAVGLHPATGTRGVLALAVALLAGGATWTGFRWLDRQSAGQPSRRRVTDGAPVLRRADAHPDAPARRPIFAGSDLGTPLDLVDPLPVGWSSNAPPPSHPVVAVPPAQTAEPVIAPPAIAPAEAAPGLVALMGRLEIGLARKALALGGDSGNVTPLKRSIPPVGGSLADAMETLRQRTAGRR